MKQIKYHYINYHTGIGIVLLSVMAMSSCKKDWLDAKPNNSLIIPSSISDFQAILDNQQVFNINYPYAGEESTDDFFFTSTDYSSVTALVQSLYTWQVNIPFGGPGASTSDFQWSFAYSGVLYANEVLDGIGSVTPDTSTLSAWNNVKGSALFYRGTEFYNLALIYTKPYDPQTAGTDEGIPIKLSSNINQVVGRDTLQQTYNQILADLKAAIPLLPAKPLAGNLFRPSKMGAYGMLSRVYLSMNDYVDAGKYADSSLQINDALMDFNSFTINGNDPIAEGNVEMDFDYWMASGADGELTQNASVDTTLYGLYQANDLRKVCFFAPRGNYYSFLGSYVGIQFILWGGIATDEMYLTRAECEARNGNVDSAMADLNTLLTTRWTTGEFVPYTASGPADAINQILMERRKELLFRGTRWLDLRRLNKDPNYAVTLTRNVNGQIFTLPPNDPRYVFLIPPAETSYNNIPQNQR